MATHLSTAFDRRKKCMYHANFKTPINGVSKISRTEFPREEQKNVSSNKTVAELKLVQEWRSMKTMSMEIEPSCSNVHSEVLEAYPFVEEPVSFHFGDDYGKHLFLDSKKELSYERQNHRLSHGGRGVVVEDIKYSSDDIYVLSPEAGIMDSFLRDNLF